MIYTFAILQGVTAVATAHPATPATPAAMIVSLDQTRPSGIVIAGQGTPPDMAPSAQGVTLTPVTAAPIHVRVTAAGRLLLDDTFRVAPAAGANYQESRSEAPEAICTGQRYYSSQERYALNMNMYVSDNSTP